MENLSGTPATDAASGQMLMYIKSDHLYIKKPATAEVILVEDGTNLGSPTANPDGADVFSQKNASGQLEFRRLTSSDGTVNFDSATDSNLIDITVDLTDINDELDHGTLLGLGDDDHLQYLLLAGRSGGQVANGGIDASDDLTLNSTAHATKGKILFGDGAAYDDALDNLGIGTQAPASTARLDIQDTQTTVAQRDMVLLDAQYTANATTATSKRGLFNFVRTSTDATFTNSGTFIVSQHSGQVLGAGDNTGLNVATFSGMNASPAVGGSASTIIGHYIAMGTNAQGVTDSFAIQIKNITGGVANVTNPWGMYQEEALVNNAFAGKVRFGSLVKPTEAIDVTGKIQVSSDIIFSADGGGSIGEVAAKRPDRVSVLNTINLNSLTASQPVVSDASKNLVSLSYASFGGNLDHGDLLGLGDDDHTQYLLLAGRSGGQIANGGIDASDDLELRSTANATKGRVKIIDGSEFQHSSRVMAEATVQTTDATVTNCGTIALSDDRVYNVIVRVIARRSDGGAEARASWQFQTTAYRAAAGSATLQGSVKQEYKSSSTSGLDANLDVDTNDLRVRVTGKASEDFEWKCYVDYIESD
jgi:hypothetical protein